MLALHLGALHPVEKVLVFVLALGPFVLLGLVILVQRHRDAGADDTGVTDAPDDEPPSS